MDDQLSQLETEFCPPLDSAVFFAIASDYDLSSKDGLTALRQTLDTLKESAAEEEDSGFDPSGTSAHVFGDTTYDADDSEHAPSHVGTGTITSENTDSTELSAGLRSLGLHADLNASHGDYGDHAEYKHQLDKLDNATKVEFLRSVFPEVSEYSIGHTLKSCHGDVERASEELMNHVFFNEGDVHSGEERILAKGVDAFSEDSTVRRGRKKQSKKKGRLSHDVGEGRRASSLPSPMEPPRVNAWTKTSTGSNTPTYHPQETTEITPQYIRPHLLSQYEAVDDSPWTHVRPRSKPTTRPTSPTRLPAHTSSDPSALASLYSQFQRNAMSQAAAARQRGKSDHYMIAAAGHYTQVGRDFAMKSKAARQEAADTFVSDRSTRHEIDLHYVRVEDAKRIAKSKTEEWWGARGRRVKGLDGRWTDEGGGAGGELRIVTGVGHHSEGGRARIKPAVEAMLVRDGWEFDSREGVISVIGKKR